VLKPQASLNQAFDDFQNGMSSSLILRGSMDHPARDPHLLDARTGPIAVYEIIDDLREQIWSIYQTNLKDLMQQQRQSARVRQSAWRDGVLGLGCKRPGISAAWLLCVWPSFASPALLGALFGSFAGFLDAVGFAVDGDDLGVVHQAIDHGYDAGGIGEDVTPFGERPV
jgi:hypothetical protein